MPEDLFGMSWRRRTWIRTQRHDVVFCRAWNEEWLLFSVWCVVVSAASHIGGRAEGAHVLGRFSEARGTQVKAKAHDQPVIWSLPF
jgi:hypothetical protein